MRQRSHVEILFGARKSPVLKKGDNGADGTFIEYAAASLIIPAIIGPSGT
jgi:hypothetical protein